MAIRKPKDKEQAGFDGYKLGHELIGLFSIFFALLLILSLASFDSRDPWLNHVVSSSGPVHNKAGLFGSSISGILYDLCGIAAWVVPVFFCLVGARRILTSPPWPWWRWMGILLAIFVISFAGAHYDVNAANAAQASGAMGTVAKHGGGLLGHALYQGLVNWLSITGAWLIWTLCFLLTIQMLLGFSWISVAAGFAAMLWQTGAKMAEDLAENRRQKLERLAPGQAESGKSHDLLIESSVKKVSNNTKTQNKIEESSQKNVTNIIYLNNQPSVFSRLTKLFKKENSYSTEDLFNDLGAFTKNTQTIENNSQGFDENLNIQIEKLPPCQSEELRLPSKDEENDLPPWVLDFEADRHGVQDTDENLRPDFSEISGTNIPKQEQEQKSFFDILQGNTNDMEEDYAGKNNDKSYENQASKSNSAPTVPIKKEVSDSILPATSTSNSSPRKETAPHIALPTLDLIEALPSGTSKSSTALLEKKGKALITCLTDFGVEGDLVGITPGPVVTMFEVRPAPGVRVSRIANLSDDLALALKAVAVRIQAPVPGTDTVGIEIPNENRETVCLRTLFESDTFQKSKSLLTLALGKDIAGNPAVADLASMPHLLVAGATGSGKSVGINAIILSLLYKAKPEEVRLLLIDPKRVEMAIYEDLPHLVHPVVTDMQLAKNALDWAVKEMEERYTLMAKASVRNISSYNAKINSLGDDRPDDLKDFEPMPYLVIIIDELADLMLVAAKEVETSIIRLAQLARAAGIHLILATQRPSVDVVTGLIKANFPCRMAFQVSSKHDSRTILDAVGAEYLLGKGDMLYKLSGGRFQRLHGAFVSDDNVKKVVDYWKALQEPDYGVNFADWGAPDLDDLMGVPDAENDPVYNEAVQFVIEQDRASISLIQRRFRIGYNKAARYVEQMEADGIVGPADGSRPREVIFRKKN